MSTTLLELLNTFPTGKIIYKYLSGEVLFQINSFSEIGIPINDFLIAKNNNQIEFSHNDEFKKESCYVKRKEISNKFKSIVDDI